MPLLLFVSTSTAIIFMIIAILVEKKDRIETTRVLPLGGWRWLRVVILSFEASWFRFDIFEFEGWFITRLFLCLFKDKQSDWFHSISRSFQHSWSWLILLLFSEIFRRLGRLSLLLGSRLWCGRVLRFWWGLMDRFCLILASRRLPWLEAIIFTVRIWSFLTWLLFCVRMR